MTRPDPAAELAAIRQDIRYLTERAMLCQDHTALVRLQTSLVRWLQKQEEQDA